MKKKFINQYTGIMLPITFFVLFAVNSLVLYLANMFFPSHIVLGNQTVSYGWAFIHSMATLAILNVFLIPLVRVYENKIDKMITSLCWMKIYFVTNFVGLWILARFANQLGMGLSSWVVALFLALALDIVQGITMMWLGKFKK
jgi:hypothetical protein